LIKGDLAGSPLNIKSEFNNVFMNGLQDFNYLKFKYGKEELPELFGISLDTFPNVTRASVTGHMYLWELLNKIKYNFAEDINVEHLLIDKYVDGRLNPAYSENKEQLPATCYNAVFYGYKNCDNIKSITNLMFLDIDDFGTTEEVNAYKDYITTKYDWIVSCNLSLSRLGLHVIALVNNINDNEDFNRKYEFVSTTYFDGLLDPNSKSLTRYSIIPYDLNIYINESPNVLDIDSVMEEIKKGIRSVHKEREEICTEYTFSSSTPLKQTVNESARKNSLRFKQEADESFFVDKNVPLYYPEGIDVIEVNLFPYHDHKISERKGISSLRASFIGSLTVKMIYLNAVSPSRPIKDIRKDILRFIMKINGTICDPPLPYNQVINSYNDNWKKFIAGELDFRRYFKKQRAFWSRECTLNSNEKRKITCRIKNEPTVKETKRKIKEGIESLWKNGEKITQQNVTKICGLKLPTIKKYRAYFHECKNLITENESAEVNNDEAGSYILEFDSVNKHPTKLADNNEETLTSLTPKEDIQIAEISTTKQEIYEAGLLIIENHEQLENVITKPELSEELTKYMFERIFGNFKTRLTTNQADELFKRFKSKFLELRDEDARIMTLPMEELKDSAIFFKQTEIDNRFWCICENLL